MTNLRKPILLVSVAVIVGVLGFEYLRLLKPAQAREAKAACRGLRPTTPNKAMGPLPARAPDFSAQDHTGKMVSLSDYRGKVVVVRFWGSWCETCKAEQPSLEAFAREMDDQDLIVLAPSSDDSWEPISKKLSGGSHTVVLLDPPGDEAIGPVAAAYGVGKVPETFIIDRQGIVRYYLVNKRDWRSSVTNTCIRSLLDE